MKKPEVLSAVSKRATKLATAAGEEITFTRSDVDYIVTAYGEIMLEHLQKADDDTETVPLFNVGKFAKKVVKGRKGVSSLTGKEYESEDKRNLVFKPFPSTKRLS